MAVWHLPAFHAAARQPWSRLLPFPQGTEMRMHYSSPGSFLADFTLFPQQMWASIPLHLWAALSRNGRQGMLPPSQRPAFVWEQRALMAALPLPPGKPQGPRPDPAREAGIPAGREDGEAGIFLFLLGRQALAIRCLSHGKHGPVLGLRGLGPCLWARLVSGQLFLLGFQVNIRQILAPLSCHSLPRKLSELWNFSFYFPPSWPRLCRRQQVPLVRGMSSRHNTGKWRRGNFTSRDPVWRDEAVWACQRDGAGGWEQEGLMDEPLPDLHKPPQRGAGREPPEPGESGPGDRRQLILLSGRHGNSGHGTRLQSKHTAFDRACSDYAALCSGAAAPRELGLGRSKNKPSLFPL